MKVGVENGEVGNAGKQAQRLAHDVDGDGRVQRRKGRVALDLVDQLRRDALVFAALSGPPQTMRWPMAAGAGNSPELQRIGHQLESDGAVGQRRRLVHQLFAVGILDPELAEVGADAVDRALEEPCPFAVAGFVH